MIERFEPVVRLLLRIYPPTVGGRDREEMLATYRRRASEPRGPSAVLGFLVREWAGFLAAAWSERLAERARRREGPAGSLAIPERVRMLGGRGRQALRSFTGSPGFTLPAVATLALGFGAVLAVAGVVDHVILRPLPYPGADELLFLDHAAPGIGAEKGLGFTPGMFWHVSQRTRTLESVAAFSVQGATLADHQGPPERLRAAMATPSLGRVLATRAELGRWFLPEEGEEKLVVLSHGLFERRYGGDPAVLGSSVLVDREPYRVLGVMPPDFRYPEADVALWVPLRIDATTDFGGFWLRAVGRRASGVGDEAVATELDRLLPSLAESYPDRAEMIEEILRGAGVVPRVAPLREEVLGGVEELLWILLGSVVLVLLLVGANVGNLVVVRTEGRQRERAVRRALGACRRDRISEAATEAAILAGAGAVAGSVLGWGALRILRRLGPAEVPRLHEVGFDLRVFGLATLLWAGAAAAFALVACWRPGEELAGGLSARHAAAGLDPAGTRRRELLIAVQMALALVLTVGSGLLLRTFLELRAIDPGFSTAESTTTFRVSLPRDVVPERRSAGLFVSELRERLGALPGVEAVGAVSCLPLEGWCSGDPLQVEGRPNDPDEIPPVVALRRADPGAFAALEIPLLEGRAFEEADSLGGAPVVVVSRRLARLYFPGESALGRRVRPPTGNDEPVPWHTIVGVVGDTPARELTEPDPMIYFPLGAETWDNVSSWDFAVAVRGDEPIAREVVASLVAELQPQAPVSHLRSARDLVRRAMARLSFLTLLVAVTAGIALALGAIGLFGVVAYLVGRRVPEIGVRLALGARRRDIQLLILGQAGRAAGLGLLAGTVFATAGAGLVESQLVGVSPHDPVAFAGAVGLSSAVAFAAALLPARRAARLDPSESLRSE